MSYELFYSESAKKDLEKIDRPEAQRIIKKLDTIIQSTDPLSYAKSLSGVLKGLYRFRAGNYRAIFKIDKEHKLTLLIILTIKHRRDVYNLL